MNSATKTYFAAQRQSRLSQIHVSDNDLDLIAQGMPVETVVPLAVRRRTRAMDESGVSMREIADVMACTMGGNRREIAFRLAFAKGV